MVNIERNKRYYKHIDGMSPWSTLRASLAKKCLKGKNKRKHLGTVQKYITRTTKTLKVIKQIRKNKKIHSINNIAKAFSETVTLSVELSEIGDNGFRVILSRVAKIMSDTTFIKVGENKI